MAEYIEKDEALAIIENRQREICPMGLYRRNAVYGSDRETFDNWQEILDEIEAIPSADVAPVRHGRWLGWGKSGTPTYENYGTCSVCGEDAEIYTEHRNYCPNCGAKMDGDG